MAAKNDVSGTSARNTAMTPLLLGLGFFWPLLRQYEFGNLFNGTSQSTQAMTLAPLVVALAVICSTVPFLVLRARLEPRLLTNRLPTVLFSLACLLGLVLLFTSAHWDVQESSNVLDGFLGGAFLCGGVLMGAGYCGLMLAFMEALCAVGESRAIVCLAVSYVLSALVSMTSFLPAPVPLILTFLSPLACGASLMLFKCPPRQDTDFSWRALGRIPLAPVLLLGLFLVVSRIAIGMFNQASAVVEPFQRVISLLLVVATALAILAIVTRSRADRWSTYFRIGWSVLAIVAIAGILMLSPLAQGFMGLGLGVMGAVLDCFEIFLWINLAVAAIERRLSSVLVFGVFFTAFKITPIVVGKLLTPIIVNAKGIPPAEMFAPFALAMVLLLIAAVVFFLAGELVSAGIDSHSRPAQNGSADQPRVDPRENALAQLAIEFGLTAREKELLDYLSRGFSYQAISAKLGISTGTAQSYARGLYRKAYVHSKQDVIALVDAKARKMQSEQA